MRPLYIPIGFPVVLGQPARPMPQALTVCVGEMVRGITAIREAYLPQSFMKGVVEPPVEILVLVLDGAGNHQSVLDAVGQGLRRVLPQGTHLDVWPMKDRDSLLSTVRGTQTHIHCSPPPEKKPWWRSIGGST